MKDIRRPRLVLVFRIQRQFFAISNRSGRLGNGGEAKGVPEYGVELIEILLVIVTAYRFLTSNREPIDENLALGWMVEKNQLLEIAHSRKFIYEAPVLQ